MAACPELSNAFHVCVVFDEPSFRGELCRRGEQVFMRGVREVEHGAFFEVEERGVTDGAIVFGRSFEEIEDAFGMSQPVVIGAIRGEEAFVFCEMRVVPSVCARDINFF